MLTCRSLILLTVFTVTSSIDYEDYGEIPDFLVTGGYRPPDLSTLAKFTVSLRSKDEEKFLYGSGHFCGGTIIGNRAVLTAAHCTMSVAKGALLSLKPSNFVVVAGSPIRLETGQYGRTYEVAKIIRHDDFSFATLRNDIAIVRIKEDFQFSKYVQKSLIPEWAPTAEEICTVVGWGRIFHNGPLANKIIYADLLIWDTDTCSKGSPSFDKHTMVCAISSLMEGISACQGDSGGPLFCTGNNVSGIVSYGEGCGQKLTPGYYTKVYAFREWIRINGSRDSKSCLERMIYGSFLCLLISLFRVDFYFL